MIVYINGKRYKMSASPKSKLSRHCTSIIVTHRLASAQIADRILVIKDGHIVQDGSHKELIAVEGEYKTMFELQRQWYQCPKGRLQERQTV